MRAAVRLAHGFEGRVVVQEDRAQPCVVVHWDYRALATACTSLRLCGCARAGEGGVADSRWEKAGAGGGGNEEGGEGEVGV